MLPDQKFFTNLATAFDADHFRREGHKLVDVLARYLEEAQQLSLPVLNWEDPLSSVAKWRERLNSPEISFEQLITHYIKDSNHLHHPGYVGHQVAPVFPLAGLTELLTGVLNTGMAVYEMSPAGTPIEICAVEWLAKTIGFENGSGFFTSGGTLGNLTALIAAKKAKQRGERTAVLVSEQSHYSIQRAAQILGWDEEAVIPISTGPGYQISLSSAEQALTQARAKQREPILLVANAGSTSVGAYDPLEALADFCQTRNLWFHVDGAHGASAVFSKKYAPLVRGIEKADSLVWDCHKLMLVPSLSTLVLFKRKSDANRTFSQQAAYLFRKSAEEEWYNLSHRTFECTKRDLAFRLMAIRSLYGEGVFGEIVDYSYALARTFAEKIAQDPAFELALLPQSNIVCFRYGQHDALQDRIREEILKRGNFYLVRTKLKNGVFLRTTLMNPLTKVADLERLLEEIKEIAQGLGRLGQD